MKKDIIIMDDSWMLVNDLREDFRRFATLDSVDTELGFRKTVDIRKGLKTLPDLIILEQRAPWTNPAPYIEHPPEDIRAAGPRFAGIRCYDYLRAAGFNTPVIFYTLEDEKALEAMMRQRGIQRNPRTYQFVEKDETYENLFQAVRRVL
jgi:hypothetical protein